MYVVFWTVDCVDHYEIVESPFSAAARFAQIVETEDQLYAAGWAPITGNSTDFWKEDWDDVDDEAPAEPVSTSTAIVPVITPFETEEAKAWAKDLLAFLALGLALPSVIFLMLIAAFA